MILPARFFLQNIIFIKFISTLPECLKKYMKLNRLYSVENLPGDGKFHHKKWNISSLVSYFFKHSGSILINFMIIILCKINNLARSNT